MMRGLPHMAANPSSSEMLANAVRRVLLLNSAATKPDPLIKPKIRSRKSFPPVEELASKTESRRPQILALPTLPLLDQFPEECRAGASRTQISEKAGPGQNPVPPQTRAKILKAWVGTYFFRIPLYGPFDFLWSRIRPVLVSSFTYRPVTGFLTCTRSLIVPARDPVPVFLAIGVLTDTVPPISIGGSERPGNSSV